MKKDNQIKDKENNRKIQKRDNWIMRKDQIRKQLEQEAEADYREFQAKLLPGVANILGVRLPKLREIAKQAAKQDAREYLEQMRDGSNHVYYEEKMLFGLVLGYAEMEFDGRRNWLDVFVPVIDNWGVCDSCCVTYKWMRRQPDDWWEYVRHWALSDTEFGIRFGLVSMLDHFVDEAHLEPIFAVCSQIRRPGYYAKMAQAWLVSMCFVQFPEQTYQFLQEGRMEDFTHNKSIQKTCESYRVAKEWKAKLRSLRKS